MVRLLALALLISASSPAGQPGALHVDPASGRCSDARTAQEAQSPSTPLCSIARGLDLAADGGVVVVHAGAYPQLKVDSYRRAQTVTVVAAPGEQVSLAGVELSRCQHLRIQGFTITSRVDVLQDASDIDIVGNDIGRQRSGIYLYGWVDPPGRVTNVRITANTIHDIDYDGTQGPGDGYGIAMVGNVDHVTIDQNTIRSVAEDYIQGGNSYIDVRDNTFLGPGLSASHPDAHADLWQVYGTADHLSFDDNVVRDTGTSSGLLFQFSSAAAPHRAISIANNLFDRGSQGYEMQIYNTIGLRVVNNTILNDAYGIVFRRDDRVPDGSDYVVANNIVSAAPGRRALNAEAFWGTEDFNWIVTPGPHSGPWGRHDVVGGTPRFVDPQTGDLRLVPGSRGTGAGDAAVATATDPAGRQRPAGPDVGAYQAAPLGPGLASVTLAARRLGVWVDRAARLQVRIQPAAGRERRLNLRTKGAERVDQVLRPGLPPGTYVVTIRATGRDGKRSQAIRTVTLP